MSNQYTIENTIPIAPLKLAVMENFKTFGQQVNDHIVTFRRNDAEALKGKQGALEFLGYDNDSYLLNFNCPRFGTGEAKAVMNDSVRGADVFILADVMNYSLTYKVCGHLNHMSPDDHYQDLKRVIGACGTAKRVNVVMPFLYESRQHKRTRRESLDCAMALEELTRLGVANIITFDAHDPRVSNAIPLNGFDNFMPSYQFLKALLMREGDNLKIDKEHLMVISPDEGAMSRNVYFASNLGVDMGMFYKRRDYSTIINGKNPIVAHEFLGTSVEGKTVIIVDDMISSGESMLDTARELKERKADKVIVCCTFGLFTDGFDKFDEFYAKGYLDYVITTNLCYLPDELLKKPWYLMADMTKYTAAIINSLNHDVSLSGINNQTPRIQALLQKYNNK